MTLLSIKYPYIEMSNFMQKRKKKKRKEPKLLFFLMILLYLDLGTNGCDGNQNAKKDYNSTEAIALTLSKDKGKDAEENQRCRDQKIDQLWIPVPDLLTCTGICLVAVFFSISIHFLYFSLRLHIILLILFFCITIIIYTRSTL